MFELSKDVIAGFVRASTAVRKFAMKMPAGNKGTPLMIKVRASVHSSMSSSSGWSSNGEVATFSTLEARYKRLIEVLDQRSSGVADMVVLVASTSADPKLSSSLASIRQSKTDNSSESVNNDCASARPKRALPALPIGVCQSESQRKSLLFPDATLLCRRELVHHGPPVVVVDVLLHSGSWVVCGSDVFIVKQLDESELNDEAESEVMNQLSYQPRLYADGNLYDVQSSNSGYAAESTRRASQATDDLKVAVWNVKEAGKIIEVFVKAGSVCKDGDVLCHADCSLIQQQFAYLSAADVLQASHQLTNATNLNERYQLLTERLIENISMRTPEPAPLLQCCDDIERVVRDFMETARMYGRLIISEMHLPLERKTIRPLKMGGVLGGAKFVVRGVLFKIPQADAFASYPDPIYIANKIQGHELKGLKAYFGWFFNRGSVGLVSFPLTAVIDYKGHRITAMTQLPIKGKETLVYGSDNAGGECDVMNSVPEWSAFIREASVGLNLKPHFAVNGRSSGDEIEIASCVDLEGHKGLDRRYYLLDFSRTFPCVYKDTSAAYDKFWPFYHMMRPEFVKQWNRPLSADAYSNFQSTITASRKEEAKENNQEIRAATTVIETTVVVNVCKALFASYDESFSLRHIFHRGGLNMRYLGLVYSKLVGEMYESNKQNLYKLVQVESLMRIFKLALRGLLRKTQQQAKGEDSESLLLVACANALNDWFCLPDSVSIWKQRHGTIFCHLLVSAFNFTNHHANLVMDAFLGVRTSGGQDQEVVAEVSSTGDREVVSLKFAVLRRLNDAMGLGIKEATLSELRLCGSSGMSGGIGAIRRGFARRALFSDTDLKFEERVKHLDVVERARGLSELLQSETVAAKGAAAEHLLKGYGILESALEASPNDPWLSSLMGDVCSRMHYVLNVSNKKRVKAVSTVSSPDAAVIKSLVDSVRVIRLFHDRTLFFYQQAAKFENNAQVFVKLALFISSSDDGSSEATMHEVEDLFLKALEICAIQNISLDERALIGLVRLLEKRGNSSLALELRDKTKSFVSFRDHWLGVKSKKSEEGSGCSSSGASPRIRERKFTMGSRTRSPRGEEASSLQDSLNEVVKLDVVPKTRGPILRAVTKFSNAVVKRRSPRGELSSVGSSARNSESVIENNSTSGRSSKIEDELDDNNDEVLEFQSDMLAAMERNQKLREAVSMSQMNQKEDGHLNMDEEDDDDDNVTIAEGLQNFFRSAAGYRVSNFTAFNPGNEK